MKEYTKDYQNKLKAYRAKLEDMRTLEVWDNVEHYYNIFEKYRDEMVDYGWLLMAVNCFRNRFNYPELPITAAEDFYRIETSLFEVMGQWLVEDGRFVREDGHLVEYREEMNYE